MALYTLQEAKKKVAELRAKGSSFENALQFLVDQGYPSELLDQLKAKDFVTVTSFRQTKPKDEHPLLWVLLGVVVVIVAAVIIIQVNKAEQQERESTIREALEASGYGTGATINIKTSEGELKVVRTNTTANITGSISINYFTIRNAFLDPNTRSLNRAVKLCRAMGELFDNANRGRGSIALKYYEQDSEYLKITKWAVLALAINERKITSLNVEFTDGGTNIYSCDVDQYIQDTTLDRIQITNLY